MQEYLEFCNSLRRAFAMMALAMMSAVPRDELIKTTKYGIRQVAIPTDVRDKLRLRVARGDVTCIVAKPEPFVWLVITSAHEEFRAIYGIWVGRPASWRGKIDHENLPHLDAMTPAEAIAKGIPIPGYLAVKE